MFSTCFDWPTSAHCRDRTCRGGGRAHPVIAGLEVLNEAAQHAATAPAAVGNDNTGDDQISDETLLVMTSGRRCQCGDWICEGD